MDTMLKLGILLLAGLIGGRIARIFKLPNVSGYLIAGVLVGPSIFGVVNVTDVANFTILSEIALAVLAFSIGSEFVLKDLKKLGKRVVIITLTQATGAVLFVFSIMYFVFRQDFAFSIVIASMSAATAPAATMLVVRQFNADGPLVRTMLPVVALDDIYGIMAFGIALPLAKMSISTEAIPIWSMILDPFVEIGGSLLIGGLLGFLLSFVTKRAKSRDDIKIVSIAAVAIALGLAKLLGLSSLLMSIMMGTVLANLNKKSNRVFETVDEFISPFYVLFFTVAGAGLELGVIRDVGIMGICYVFARGFGKWLGAFLSARATHADKAVQKYLGLTLLPQGGISIGLSIIVRQELPVYAVAITTIIMFSILIYETSGPIFAKIAIAKAGEINGMALPAEANLSPAGSH
ncbi:MAG TPA: cation:proton antiporter [Acholeplasmatales bacterium]|nr:MAG: sodium:proton exchanger [Tenericutes bacterium GWF2_57_13]HAQ56469.1 cation:proton antiporter [Acholeplasmatales bacterium]